MIKINVDQLVQKYTLLLIQRGPIIASFLIVLVMGLINLPSILYEIIFNNKNILLLYPMLSTIIIIYIMYYALVVLQSKISFITTIGYSNIDKYIISEYWKGHIKRFDAFFKSIGFPIDFIKNVPLLKKTFASILYLIAILVYALALSSVTIQSKIINYPDKTIYFIAFLISFSVTIMIATLFRNLARSIIRISVNEQKEKDKRKPIVYLRAFKQDNFFLNSNILMKIIPYLQGKTTLDPIMLEECSTIAPVIALGNPKEEKSPYGPPRYYAKNEEWKNYVHSILKDAKYIYMFLQDTDGVKWEVEQLVKMNKLQKSIFIVAPKSKSENILKYFEIIIKSASLRLEESKIDGIKSKIIKKEIMGFFITEEEELVVFEGVERGWIAYFLVIRASLRLKVAFDENLFSKSEIETTINKAQIKKNRKILFFIIFLVGSFLFFKG